MCLIDREPVFVTWTRTDNSSLPNDAFIRGETLYIDNVQPSAAGEYRCIGTKQSTGQVVFAVAARLDVIGKNNYHQNLGSQNLCFFFYDQ